MGLEYGLGAGAVTLLMPGLWAVRIAGPVTLLFVLLLVLTA